MTTTTNMKLPRRKTMPTTTTLVKKTMMTMTNMMTMMTMMTTMKKMKVHMLAMITAVDLDFGSGQVPSQSRLGTTRGRPSKTMALMLHLQ